jgi:hypothetical protein
MNFGIHLSEAVVIPNPIWMLPTRAPLQGHSYGTQFPCPHPTLTHVNKFSFWAVAKGTSHLLRVHTQSICTKDDQLTDTDVSNCLAHCRIAQCRISTNSVGTTRPNSFSSNGYWHVKQNWSVSALQHAAVQKCVLIAKQVMPEQLLWA